MKYSHLINLLLPSSVGDKLKIFLNIPLAILIVSCSDANKATISASGTIETTEVTISAKVRGEIKTLLVDEGSSDRKSDTVALVSHSTSDIELMNAEANLTAAQAQYKLAVQGAREEDIAQADATLKNVEDDLNRLEGLFKEGSITQKQLDDARTRYIVTNQLTELTLKSIT